MDHAMFQNKEDLIIHNNKLYSIQCGKLKYQPNPSYSLLSVRKVNNHYYISCEHDRYDHILEERHNFGILLMYDNNTFHTLMERRDCDIKIFPFGDFLRVLFFDTQDNLNQYLIKDGTIIKNKIIENDFKIQNISAENNDPYIINNQKILRISKEREINVIFKFDDCRTCDNTHTVFIRGDFVIINSSWYALKYIKTIIYIFGITNIVFI
jgi:hypothetical protein